MSADNYICTSGRKEGPRTLKRKGRTRGSRLDKQLQGIPREGMDVRVGMASRLAHLELREVEETTNVLGTGSYGVVVEMNVGGLK